MTRISAPFRRVSLHARLCNYSALIDGHLQWVGPMSNDGYGRLQIDRVRSRAHRVAYELWVGPIPEGLTLDHLCRVRRCIWPEHLEAVTSGENVLRGEGPSAREARQTHCIHGHPFTPENTWTYVVHGRPKRYCQTCVRRRAKASSQRKRDRFVAMGLTSEGNPWTDANRFMQRAWETRRELGKKR